MVTLNFVIDKNTSSVVMGSAQTTRTRCHKD